ncbi:MAG: DUF2927 domain-containing protein [Lachnospiraceae bacterium]|nr:DUF2927 domain-containing protein [Lachnospiraceae bacterium]
MKKLLLIFCILAALLLCYGCGGQDNELTPGSRREAAPTPVPTEITPTETPTVTPTSTPTPTAAPTPTPVPDNKMHPEEYGYTAEQVLLYFLETGLQAEYTNGKDYNYIKKWTAPVIVSVEGNPDEDDYAVMNKLFEGLNKVPGFPGIRFKNNGEDYRLVIRFLDDDSYKQYAYQAIGDVNTDGYSLIYFYDGEISTAEIGIRTSLTRTNKNHVILEEIVQSLGIQNDSYSYPDSLFYQGYNEPQEPTVLDWLLVEFMYRDEIKPLMRAEQVMEAAEQIFAH